VDESLFTLFVIAVGAVFYAIAPVVFDETKVFTRQHPPEALRMNYVMHSAKSWCNQNRRPLVERWISLQIFQIAMAGVAEAIFATSDPISGERRRGSLCRQTRGSPFTAICGLETEIVNREMPPLSHDPSESHGRDKRNSKR
jgi:hypothetical protein